jgi:hypothetical protein
VLPQRSGQVSVIGEAEISGKSSEIVFARKETVERGADPQLGPVPGDTPAGDGRECAAEMV